MYRGRVPEVANGVRIPSGRAHAPAGSSPAPSADQTSAYVYRLDDVQQVMAIVNPAAGGDPHGLLDEPLHREQFKSMSSGPAAAVTPSRSPPNRATHRRPSSSR